MRNLLLVLLALSCNVVLADTPSYIQNNGYGTSIANTYNQDGTMTSTYIHDNGNGSYSANTLVDTAKDRR